MTARPAAPESETPEIERFTKLANATLFEVERAAMKGIAHPAAVLHQGKEYELAQALREAATALSLAQTEIKGHMRVMDELRAELQIVQPKAQVMHDLHNALGVKWGCDPYAEIRRLKGIEKLREEILAQNTKAQARIAELEKDAARYKWLREARNRRDPDRPVVPSVSYIIDCISNPDEFDAAIDDGIATDG